jgi:hypothetical protein
MAARIRVAVCPLLQRPVKVVSAGINRPDEQMCPCERDAESNGAEHAEDKKDERIIHGD